MEKNSTTPSQLLAMAQCKCPRCRKGRIFEYSALNLPKFAKTYGHCPVCDLRFEREPGFFVGAMYFGYAISIATFVTVAVAIVILSTVFQFQTSVSLYVTSIITVTLLMAPVNFRYSRVLMLYFFGGDDAKYQADAAK
ncbi:MAG: DUF983 domain-containing protein [Cytophagales bacterium]|nr:MAG: DUF983 domain-containing protein [Cytophagales bacterium]